MYKDLRSKNFIFVPFCTLSQSFMANGLVKSEWPSVLKPIIDICMQNNLNIIQMPCIETLYWGKDNGLGRNPKSYDVYNNKEFREFSTEKAQQVVCSIEEILQHGFSVVAILGIEYSPSCAVSLQYAGRKGTLKKSGIFIDEMVEILRNKNISIPMIGINRRWLDSSVKKIEKIIDSKQIGLDI